MNFTGQSCEISGNQITDLAPLSALTSLAALRLNNNQITDIAPLSALTSLTFRLNLGGNQITDIAPLAALATLTRAPAVMRPHIYSVKPTDRSRAQMRDMKWRV
eukprot:SAG22_NODE_6748_length_816_cov_1.317992_1_plen_103_part_10